MDVDGFLELSLMVVWNGSWWLGVNVGVWNWRWWLFGIDVGGCLELSFVVVWNCRWWLFGTTNANSKQPLTRQFQTPTLLVVWNQRWWFQTTLVDNWN